MIGGAIGNTLEYPVEFVYSYEDIQNRYSKNGTTRLDNTQWWAGIDLGKAVISDDTQITWFTAMGLLNAKEKGIAPVPAICQAIKQIGEGWVAKETLAIAVYCVAKYFDDFEKALVASVNHSGDSDSTRAVTGNILGAAIGYDALPEHFKSNLELHDVILHVADDLWERKITQK